MKRFLRIFVLLPAALLSCGSEAEIASAAKTVDGYYAVMRANRPAEGFRYFTADFIAQNPPESWAETAESIRTFMGNLVSWKLITEKSHYYTSTKGNEDTVVLIYMARYEKHYSHEFFTLVKDPKTGEYRICGMNITAKEVSEKEK